MINTQDKLLQQSFQNGLFYLLLACVIALLAFLSLRFNFEFDMTFAQRNTLSEATTRLLTKLEKPITFTVFASEDEGLRNPINKILLRYQSIKKDIDIVFIDPVVEPQMVRENNITSDGEVVIQYGKRQEHIRIHDEETYSNALQRLARTEQRWLIFTKGHGEREPHRQANHDVSDWIKIATERGYKAQAHNLSALATVPDNTAVLVIASPQVDFLAGEVAMIEAYLERGGNLLWLVDPGSLAQLDSIAAKLYVQFDPGTIVDPTGKAISITDPRFSVVTEYPSHPITRDFSVLTLFPTARSLSIVNNDTWQSSTLLLSQARSWSERGKLSGKIRFDKDTDLQGPLTIATALSRKITPKNSSATNPKSHEQRVVVVGDGDFLSNTYSGNGGNIELGLNILNWLSNDDQLMQIPIIASPDQQLHMSSTTQAIIAGLFFIIIPLGFASYGTLIWYKRRKL